MSARKKGILPALKLCAGVLFGNALLAFLVAAFVIPHDIIMGGTTGIGIVLSNVTGKDPALFVLLLNVALLLLGLVMLGKKFFFSTVASSVLYPGFLALFRRVPGVDALTDNSLLAAIFTGCLMGVALGLVMRVGSSTGGMDVVCLIASKKLHVPTAVTVWVTDIAVVGSQAFFTKPEKTLLGVLVLMLETIVLDQVMLLGRSQLQVYVISDRYEEIRRRLLHELELGVTMSLIETGLLGKSQKGVLCVVHPRQLYQVTSCIRETDPQAFITITKIKEVHGKGFTLDRIALDEHASPSPEDSPGKE